jgi:hypothetical protein
VLSLVHGSTSSPRTGSMERVAFSAEHDEASPRTETWKTCSFRSTLKIPLHQRHPKRRPHRDVVVVKVVAGVVHHAGAGAGAVAVADEEIAAGEFFQHVGEVFAGGDGGAFHTVLSGPTKSRATSYAKRASASVFTSTGSYVDSQSRPCSRSSSLATQQPRERALR